MWRGLIVVFCIVYGTVGAPSLQDGDIASVASLRRDVHEPLPFATEVEDLLGQGNSPANDQASKKHMKNASGKSDEGGYYKTYGSDAEGEKGYLTATYSKGNHGYKNLDTFHKQDGDKYAFEKHIAYGTARDGKKSGHNEDSASGSNKGGDHEGAGTIVDSHYTADEGDHEGHSSEHDDGDQSSYSEGAHYTDHGPESSSYSHSEGYATRDGDHGSYESHSSYSKDYGDEDGNQGGHYY
ncbi:uncharacterized protein LOC100875572 [Megachile rotundata]|uniref:uncharacterized protein LOC100875572 n=1 Tax=Megachile rotundata TaxID=143995 RepID=UPI000258EB9B|nr:PREDICTED: hyphally regulated cell wall protein 1-like [Megachile rotundata]